MISEPMQLTLDGREVPYDESLQVSRARPLRDSQEEIIAFMRLHGCVRPVQIGTVLHNFNRISHKLSDRGDPVKAKPCCPYATSDGVDALKRLTKRGLVEKVSRGTYVLTGV